MRLSRVTTSRLAAVMLATSALAVSATTTPAVAASIDDYKAIATKWLAFLPPAPKGWTRTKPAIHVVNSAFQKAMEARSIYHDDNGPAQIGIFIGAKPGFKPNYRRAAFDDEAVAKKKGFTHKVIDGRKWLVRAKKENVSYATLLGRGIVVYLAGKWVKPAQIEAMLPKFDYKGIAAVK